MAQHKLLNSKEVYDKYQELGSYTLTSHFFGVSTSAISYHVSKYEKEQSDDGDRRELHPTQQS